MFAKSSGPARIVYVNGIASVDDGAKVRVKFEVPLDIPTIAEMPEGEGLEALVKLGKNRVETDGPNTMKIAIKREFAELTYHVGRGRTQCEFVGSVVNTATITIVEGVPSLVFWVESIMPVGVGARLFGCLRRDDVSLTIVDAIDEPKQQNLAAE